MTKAQIKKEMIKLLPAIYHLNIIDDYTDTPQRLKFESLWVQYNKMATKTEQLKLRVLIFDYEETTGG